jgi:DNA modification methylase
MSESVARKKKILSSLQNAPVELKRDLDLDLFKAFPVDTSPTLSRLFRTYKRRKKPINVSFRKLVRWIKIGERATHYLHPYPAKLLPQIAHFFLAAGSFVKPQDLVLDPFGGSGTVALETILSGRDALYADVNPLARLISAVKTNSIDIEEYRAALKRIKRRYRAYKRAARPAVVNIKLWYSPRAISALSKLRRAICSEAPNAVTELLWVTFSAVARKASLADARFSVPVRPNPRRVKIRRRSRGIWTLFESQFAANVERFAELSQASQLLGKSQCIGEDARFLAKVGDTTIGLIITSPPYAGAQKYVRATSLSLGWLDLAKVSELRHLEDLTIGREHFKREATLSPTRTDSKKADRLIARVHKVDPVRATIVGKYLVEMKQALVEMNRVLRPLGHLVLIVGDNKVCGSTFSTSKFLRTFADTCGLVMRLELVDPIPSRGLMTKRHATADVIRKERILVFQKRLLDE